MFKAMSHADSKYDTSSEFWPFPLGTLDGYTKFLSQPLAHFLPDQISGTTTQISLTTEER